MRLLYTVSRPSTSDECASTRLAVTTNPTAYKQRGDNASVSRPLFTISPGSRRLPPLVEINASPFSRLDNTPTNAFFFSFFLPLVSPSW